MSDTKDTQEQNHTDEYAPRKYSLRSYAVTTIKVLLIGGGAFGALWLLDALVAR
jgi:exopolysaccharide biosynthesis predicted pyruvyltransferase EpsI